MAVSFKGSEGIAGAAAFGAPIQIALGQNTSTGTKVFTSRNSYDEVPGTLRATLTPNDANNYIMIRAHIAWGGWASTTDVGAGFRIYKSIDNGSSWLRFGPHYPEVQSGTGQPQGVATGVYKYNQGDTNSSFDSDDILIIDKAGSTSSTIFAVFWSCLYEANSRTLYWNRSINTGNAYNPIHTCTIAAYELRGPKWQ